MPAKTPPKLVVKNSPMKPTMLIAAASRTMGMLAPSRSASQPQTLGAAMRMTCSSDISTPISQAEKSSDWK